MLLPVFLSSELWSFLRIMPGEEKGSENSDVLERITPEQAIGGEHFEITSGYLMVIDQFMLGNKQFLVRIGRFRRELESPEVIDNKLKPVMEMFGATILKLEPGRYGVYRNPVESTMVVSQNMLLTKTSDNDVYKDKQEDLESYIDSLDLSKQERVAIGRVFVDTRCLVFADVKLLEKASLLDGYRKMRSSGQEKKARDLLRENGAAVRYGFNRYGDELGIFELESEKVIALWPDVVLPDSVSRPLEPEVSQSVVGEERDKKEAADSEEVLATG